MPENPATPSSLKTDFSLNGAEETHDVPMTPAPQPVSKTKASFELPKDWQRWALIGGGVLTVLLVLVGGVAAWKFSGSGTPEPTPTPAKKKKVAEVLNAIAVADRPYVKIIPGGGGTNITIGLEEIKKPAQEAEYEIEYRAGSLVKGAFGSLNVTSVPSVADVLLGSCSTGGKCTYDTDVKGGSLTLRFKGGEDYALKSEWIYIDNAKRSRTHAFAQPKAGSADSSSLTTTGAGEDATALEEIFTIDAASLAQQRFIILYQSPGFPKTVTGEVVGGPMVVSGVSAITGTAKVTFTLPSSAAGTKIMAWDGAKWNELTSTVSENKISAEGPAAGVYVVVK
jgi:hypothetical protein